MNKLVVVTLIALSTLAGLVTGHKYGYEKAQIEFKNSNSTNVHLMTDEIQNQTLTNTKKKRLMNEEQNITN